MVDADGPQERQEVWDWEVVQDDWWKTSFRTISWAYKTKSDPNADRPPLPRPPHYHDRLARGRRRRIAGDTRAVVAAAMADTDLSLNTGLCGVRAAEETLKRYEVEVAIRPSSPLPHSDERLVAFSESLSKEEWDAKVEELVGGILQLGSLPHVDSLSSDVPLWDLSALDSPTLSHSSPGTSEMTDSDTSADSDLPPSTPKATKTSYARVVSSDVPGSPTVLSPLPSKLLSAAALTFIPSTPTSNGASSREPTTPPLTSSSGSSDSPFSSPTYNFHFPSLNSMSPADRRESRSLPPSLQKDENGFYVEVPEDPVPGATQSLNGTRSTTPRRASAAFLPLFLTSGSPSPRPRNSKTREMVDRLRSSGSTAASRKGKKSNRRSPSAKEVEFPSLLSDGKSEDSNDGWISAVGSTQETVVATSQPKPNKHGHGHRRSSGSTSHSTSASSAFSPDSSTMSLPILHTPASAPAQLQALQQMYPSGPFASNPYSTPYTAPTAYMPMQYSTASRTPWPMGYQTGMYPMYQPFGVMPTAVPYGMVPVAPLQPAFYDGKGKPPGGTMVQWCVPPQPRDVARLTAAMRRAQSL